jgi:hypothetical protein
MELFSSECKHCGSKEHSSSDCPHGIFSSKCKHCESVEHSSSDCPHGIFSSKCKHCGSVDHSSDNCPQGIFSTKCKHCESTEHSSNDCPHGIFSSKCKHCGSVNHSSNDCPQGLFATREKSSSKNYSPPQDEVSTIFFFVKWGIIIAVALFVIMVAVFLAPLILLIWYLIKKREMQWVAILGMVFSAYLIFDIISGGFITSSMMKMQRTGEEKYLALGYFVVLVTTLGFFIDKYTSMKIPISNNGNFFEQKNIKERRPFIAGFSLLLLVIFSIFQFVSFSGNDSKNPYNNSNVSNTNNNNQEQTSNSTEKDISELAVISDSDGYTNLRQGKGTNFAIVQKIYTNEKFKVYPSNEKWWKVKLNNGNQGYIFHNRVNLINKDFYVINVTATQTETKALKEVKKLINLGYDAGHLWIPNYNSLSKTKMYSVYIGPFSTQDECVKQTEKYRRTNPNAYGTLVSQQNKRVEIRGQNKIKIIEPYHK